MSVSAATNNPFPIIGDHLFADSYFGATEPVNHQLPITADKDGVSFKDVVDTINPLQHIPVVSTIYRAVTGDEPAAGSRLLGSVLYGGPIGLFGEVINCAIDDNTGKDIGGHMLALFKDDAPSSAEPSAKTATQVAQAPSPIYQQAPEPASRVEDQDSSAPVAAPAPKPVVTASQLPPAPVAQPQQIAAANNSMAIAHNPSKFMAVPERRPVQVSQPVPLHTAVSSNGQHSTMPITGHNGSGFSAHAAAVQQALIDQALPTGNTPQTQAPAVAAAAPAPAPAAPAAPPVAAPVAVSSMPLESSTPANGDWFYAAMGQALEKYDRTAKLKSTPPTLDNQL